MLQEDASHAVAWRRPLLIALVVLWLTAQISIPAVLKFDLPRFHYQYVSHSWAMFGRNPLRYSVSLYVMSDAGVREPIKNLDRYTIGVRSPGPTTKTESYRSV